MTILQIFAVALLGLLLSVLLRRERPEMAVLLSIGLGVVVLAALLRQIGSLLDLITGLVARAQLDLRYAGSLTRIIGIAYLTEFGAQVCRDAGEGNLAGKVELAGKISILVLAVPIVLAVLETLLRLLPA
ncbi:MAG TPA: stage III sporulation protein AD [Sphingobacteriaceae bacterium]|nr:stage III sporulation protein AD [Sphingobacteriaceae bacterium]